MILLSFKWTTAIKGVITIYFANYNKGFPFKFIPDKSIWLIEVETFKKDSRLFKNLFDNI